MKLLHIDSGIQGERSASRAISAAIVERLAREDPGLEITYRDLVTDPVAHLVPAELAGSETRAILGEFLASDIIVIGAGLYNFSVPSQLKAWIDRILIAGQTFRYGADGRPEGLAGTKRVFIALARGGVYSAGSPTAPFEHAETYLRTVLGFIGIRQPEVIVAEGLTLGEERRSGAIAAALDRAQAVSLSAPAA